MNVPKLAKKFNGMATWTFSQSALNTWRHYRTAGICAALSVEWIKYHAHDDSLANVLGSGGVGGLNVAKLKEIALLHHYASNIGGVRQEDILTLYLQTKDIVKLHSNRSVSIENKRIGRSVNLASSRDAAERSSGGDIKIPNIEDLVVNAMRKFNTCYLRINFGGTAWGIDAGHAVAAWLGQPTYSGGGDALFFDPNCGEYWFENKQDFFRFFPQFYRETYRSFPFYFDTSWDVLPCAKRV